jgi:RNA polymerase sigma-70 factor (ECF subfamily)
MLRDRSEVEDVLQASVALAFGKFPRYAEGTNFKAWMFRFVTLEIFNRNRKRRAFAFGKMPADLSVEMSQQRIDSERAFDALLADPDVALEWFEGPVVEALETLPWPERAVLLLRSIGEFSYGEIQEMLSMPLGSVMGYLSRARAKLRLALADYAAERGLCRSNPCPGGPKG